MACNDPKIAIFVSALKNEVINMCHINIIKCQLITCSGPRACYVRRAPESSTEHQRFQNYEIRIRIEKSAYINEYCEKAPPPTAA